MARHRFGARSIDPIVAILLVGSIAPVSADSQGGTSRSREELDTIERVVEMFESPDRWDWQKPDLVLEQIGVGPAQQVADLGVGTGFFTPMLSGAVGENGKVFAVDTSQAMLGYVQQRRDLPHDNVVTVLAERDDPKLPAGEIDLVLVVNTWQYIDERLVYLDKLAAALEPSSGRVAIIDWRQEATSGPISRLPRAQVLAEFDKAGWTLSHESTDLPYQYFLIFTPPAAGS